MAGGKGTRLNATDKPKAMFAVVGRPIIDYALDPLLELRSQNLLDKIIIIVGFLGEQIVQHVGEEKAKFVWQKRQLGTGHAVMQARSALKNLQGTTLIINGDHALYRAKTFEKIMDFREDKNLTIAFGVVNSSTLFDDYGRVIRDRTGKITGVIEKLDCTLEQREITERNINLYSVDNIWLWQALDKIKSDNVKGEYYLTDIIKIAIEEGKMVETFEVGDTEEAIGINTVEEFKEVEKILSRKKLA